MKLNTKVEDALNQQINSELTSMKFDMADESGLRLLYVPDDEGKQACLDFGHKIGQAAK